MKYFFLLDLFKESSDYRYKQFQISYFFLNIYVVMLLISSIINYFKGNVFASITELFFLFVNIGIIVLFRIYKKFETANFLAVVNFSFLIIFLIIFGKGKTYMFISLYPLVAIIMLGLKKGLISSLLYSIIVIGITFFKGSSFPIIFNTIIVLAVSTGSVYYIEYTKEEVFEKIKLLSFTDQLTGLGNRKKFNTALQENFEKYFNYQEIFSMIIIDIDHFKNINDNYGHTVGDNVLVAIAKILHEHLNKEHIITRWGGEEFVLILPKYNYLDVTNKSKELIKVIENTQFEEISKLTISIGCGAINQYKFENPDMFFKEIDKALYRAKKNGRNQMVLI